MRIYTRTGDLGETALFGGPRVGKDMVRVEAYGSVDELNSWLGLVRCEPLPEDVDAVLHRLQNELFDVGAELASPEPARRNVRIEKEHVAALEADIDRFERELPALKAFVLPGGERGAASMHVARAVCRRAERRTVTLIREIPDGVSLVLLAYLNRLSDLLFVLARVVNARSGRPDVPWDRPEKRTKDQI